MTLAKLVTRASDKSMFTKVKDYTDFAKEYLSFTETGLQAEIVCQNENKYRFWQYRQDGNFNITRPINADLMLRAKDSDRLTKDFEPLFNHPQDYATDAASRELMQRGIYTIQQCIGACLDALPDNSNKARKINGDLFERLIQLLMRQAGLDCESGVVKIPVMVEGVEQCKMSYQQDLVLKENGVVKAIGSVKTSSKDRIDKVFIDKYLFARLTKTDTPHLAVFLNDVQRGKKDGKTYKVASTFLPGHFRGYTVALNPLDGVYYCDIRDNMVTDPFLSSHISTIDYLFCTDVWTMMKTAPGVLAQVEEDDDSAQVTGNA